jgi:hypothetical protein
METYIVYNRRGRFVLRTTEREVAEARRLLCGGTIQTIAREKTFRERWEALRMAGQVAA